MSVEKGSDVGTELSLHEHGKNGTCKALHSGSVPNGSGMVYNAGQEFYPEL